MEFIGIQQRKLWKKNELIYFQPANVTHIIKRPAKLSSWNTIPLDGTLEFERWQLCNKSIET